MANKKEWAYLKHDLAVPFPSGDKFRDKHKLVENGNNLRLQKVDTIDIQAQISSYEDGVSLSKMIARYKRTGDSSFLKRSQGFYADTSGMETNPARVIDNARAVAAEMAATAAEKSPNAEETTPNSTQNEPAPQNEGGIANDE